MTKGPRVDEAFARFEIMERRADLAEGRADALSLGGPAKTLADEFAELSADDDGVDRARSDEGPPATEDGRLIR